MQRSYGTLATPDARANEPRWSCRLLASLLQFLDDRDGLAAVDFAFIHPMLLLSLGTVAFGRALGTYQQMAEGAYTAARHAMVHGSTSATPTTLTELTELVRDRLMTADPALADVDVSWSPGNQPGSQVTVTVTYPFEFLLNSLPPITFQATAMATVAY
jgi:Flp pilus assembly protein TadG